jgi:TRAP-type mannitol/chloroaromatic compound transport system substrate-binding protein
MTTGRRRFLTNASAAATAVAATTIVDAPYVIAQPKVQWRLSTAYPAVLDQLQGAAHRLAKIVEEMSAGRFRIEVFPGGQIMQPFECFNAASQGKIEAYMGSAQWWRDREPAIEWFATIPFGMNPQGMAAWYYRATARSSSRKPTLLSTSCRAPLFRTPRRWAGGSGRRSARSATSRG